MVCWFAKAAGTHHRKLGLKQQNCILSGFRRNLRSRRPQGRVPSEGSRAESFLLLFSFWWLPGLFGMPGFVAASLQVLPPSSHGPRPLVELCLS